MVVSLSLAVSRCLDMVVVVVVVVEAVVAAQQTAAPCLPTNGALAMVCLSLDETAAAACLEGELETLEQLLAVAAVAEEEEEEEAKERLQQELSLFAPDGSDSVRQ
ncbi:hypothetical protein H4S06_004353 [Coemansia sp. BCRC 34490]|nr:hypothetical protein H4S06_004353 [Coemansia sp. BCRC 34490]